MTPDSFCNVGLKFSIMSTEYPSARACYAKLSKISPASFSAC